METRKDEVLETFKKLDDENQAILLAYAQIAYATQEGAKRRYGRPQNDLTAPGPLYADRNAAPMGAAALATEALAHA